jgi:hypothetical protein
VVRLVLKLIIHRMRLMKAKMLFWSALAVLILLGTIVFWPARSRDRVIGSAPTTPAAAVQARTTAEAPSSVHFYQHPEELPSWCIGYGKEFWRTRESNPTIERASLPMHGSFNLGQVIDRVAHAWKADSTGTATAVRARTYAAHLKRDGFVFSLEQPTGATTHPDSDTMGSTERLAALAARTPETPGEEDALMAGLSALANESSGGQGHGASSPGLGQQTGGPGPARQMNASLDVGFETVSICRGEGVLFSADVSPPSWAVLGNTAQASLQPSKAIEHFEARAEGVAVTWVFPRVPEGKGPVLIEARLTGVTYAGETTNGLHFADASRTARVRLGAATAVDATGARWPVPIQLHGQSLVFALSQDILSRAAYPLALDPIVAPEFGMDVPVLSPAPAAQQNPGVAANGGAFLVVWEDQRIQSPDGPSIYGTRVTGAGSVSDPNGIPISPTGASSPSVVANGAGYWVVWTDGRNLVSSGLDIFGTRVNGAGQVIDAGGVPICTATGDQFSPAATTDGANSFVVWQDGRNLTTGPDIYGARVTSGGVVSDPSGIPITTVAGAQAGPAVAFNGTDFLVVWADQRGGGDFETYGARVSDSGTVLDANGIPVSTFGGGELFPKVAANGTNFLVVWEDHRNEGAGFIDIYACRVSGSGSILDRAGFPVGTASGDRFTPTVAAGLTDYLVVWQDSRNLSTSGEDIFGARVTTGGAVTDPTGFAISTGNGDQFTPALSFNGSQYLVVWADQRDLSVSDSDIYGTLVSTGAVVAAPTGMIISSGSSDEQHPAVASNGANYLVVWQDYRNSPVSGTDIYGVRVSTTGQVLDLSAIAVCSAGGDQIVPAVTAAGSGYLVVWEDYRNAGTTGADVYGARVSGAGVVFDSSGMPISSASGDQRNPAAASNGTDHFVVWQDGRNLANQGFDIYGARVSSGGVVTDASGLPLTQAAGAQYFPAVAFNGSEYFVAWSDERNLGTSGIDVYGTRVSTAGAVLDGAGTPVTQAAGDALFPAVASAGGGFLVVWEDGRNFGTTQEDIYGARVNGSGTVLDSAGIPISVASDFQAAPGVASTGTNYLVVWQDGRTSAITGVDLCGARVATDGTLQDPTGFAINTGPAGQQFPKLASGSPGLFLVVSQSLENGAQRAVGNFVYLNEFPVILSIEVSNGAATITWLSIPNRTYRVQFTQDMATGSWTDLQLDVTAMGTTSTKVDNTVGASGQRFYRVVLLP